MSKYGQYCPVAQALEILGDRWTLLIVRDMLTGSTHFSDLERGLPGISKALLTKRLRQLQAGGVIEKRAHTSGLKTTEYQLTSAGQDLQNVINALLWWGATWAFGDPSPDKLDPLLLMWWMRNRVNTDQLPQNRIVIQFQFHGAKSDVYWLILKPDDVTLCLTDPGYEVNLLITADIATFFKLWLGRITYSEAIDIYDVNVEGHPRLMQAFPNWFSWSPASPVVQAINTKMSSH
jgi:DNA-binding HxlR family transcriptional regulator